MFVGRLNILRRRREERLGQGRGCLGGVGGSTAVPVVGSGGLDHHLLLRELGFFALAPKNKVESRDDQYCPDNAVQYYITVD